MNDIDQNIWVIEQNQLDKEIILHAKSWNRRKMCSCMYQKSEDAIIICRHLQEDRFKKFKKRIEKQFSEATKISSKTFNDLLSN